MNRFLCRIRGHGKIVGVKEVSGWVEDPIAGTYSVVYSGTCTDCGARVIWEERKP